MAAIDASDFDANIDQSVEQENNCKVSIRFNNIAHNTFAIGRFNGTLPSSSPALVIAVSEINVDTDQRIKLESKCTKNVRW